MVSHTVMAVVTAMVSYVMVAMFVVVADDWRSVDSRGADMLVNDSVVFMDGLISVLNVFDRGNVVFGMNGVN